MLARLVNALLLEEQEILAAIGIVKTATGVPSALAAVFSFLVHSLSRADDTQWQKFNLKVVVLGTRASKTREFKVKCTNSPIGKGIGNLDIALSNWSRIHSPRHVST